MKVPFVSLFFSLLLLPTPTAALWRPTYFFKNWFPNWRFEVESSLSKPACKSSLTNFRNKTLPVQTAYHVIDCILEDWPEFRKAELSAAGVILGLIPPMLSWFSPTPMDVGVVAMKEPLLAALVIMANAEIYPVGPLEWDEHMEKLAKGSDPAVEWMMGRIEESVGVWKAFGFLAPYFVATAAAANTLYLIVRLSTWAVCSFSPGLNIFPSLWIATATLCYLGGIWITWLRYQFNDSNGGVDAACNPALSLYSETDIPLMPAMNASHSGAGQGAVDADAKQRRLQIMYRYRPKQNPDNSDPIQVKMFKREWTCRFLAGVLYLGSVLHMTFGTIVFASLLFISVYDSTTLGLQLVASALASRVVLYFKTRRYDIIINKGDADGQLSTSDTAPGSYHRR